MEDGVDPGDERLVRRLRIGVRLVLYPLALGLIALAWIHFRDAPTARGHALHLVDWSGTTSQGEPMKARTGDGVLALSVVNLVERCSDGSTFTARWTPSQRRFVQHGEEVRGSAVGPGRDYSGRPVTYDNKVSAMIGPKPSGVLRGRVTWTTDHGPVRCDAGYVSFVLDRPRSR